MQLIFHLFKYYLNYTILTRINRNIKQEFTSQCAKISDHEPFFVIENVARKPRLFCATLEIIFISKSDSDVKRPDGFFDPQK